MNYREIPEGSVQVQVGLYWYTYQKVIAGNTHTFGQLFSSEGYCFYDLTVPENFDDEGNLKPASERVYSTWMSCVYTTAEEINANIISVPYEEGYEITGNTNDTVTE